MRVRCGMTALIIGVLLGAASWAVADPGDDRLFVLVAPPDAPGPGTLVAMDVGADGIPVQAESYPLGADGWNRESPQGVVIDPRGRFLFAANNVGGSISAFAIENDGRLREHADSPFATAAPPVLLATAPRAPFLYASTYAGLVALEIDDEGGIEAIQTVPLATAGIAVSPDGRTLYGASLDTRAVHAFRITMSGLLDELPRSPFAYDSNRPWLVVPSADGRRLWVLDLDTGIAAFRVGPRGALRQTGQTPIGEFTEAFAVTAGDRYLYAGPPFLPRIHGYASDGRAPVELAGSPYAAEYAVMALVADPDGRRLYQVTRELASVAPFAIGPDGGLTVLGPPVEIVTEGEAFPGGVAYLDGGVFRAAIDVSPRSERNLIPARGSRPIPVAILGDDRLDVADVLFASVRFGPGAAPPVGPPPDELRDIDGDGHPDLLLFFGNRASGLACGDTTAVLTGSTIDGREFRGRDAIRVVGCGRAESR